MYHNPVMINECIGGLNINPEGVYADVTFGGGGHSRAILERLTTGHLYAFDQDERSSIGNGGVGGNRSRSVGRDHSFLIHFPVTGLLASDPFDHTFLFQGRDSVIDP